MNEKLIAHFPIVVFMPSAEETNEKFFLIHTPEDLPVNMTLTVLATNANNSTLEAIQKAYAMGMSERV